MRFALASVVLLVACQSGAAIGTTCARNAECSSPLVCRLGRCRNECVAQRDCPLGSTCLRDQDGLGSCALLDDPDCSAAGQSCAAPLACVGRACVNVCTVGVECPAGSACVPTGDGRARCVRTDGVDAGIATDDTGLDGGRCSSPDCSGFAQVITGDGWSCARTNLGAIWCWGSSTGIGRGGDDTGCITRMGNPAGCARPAPMLTSDATGMPIPVTGADTMDAQDVGGCYIASGDVSCWGESQESAALGRGTQSYRAERAQRAGGGLVSGQARIMLVDQTAFSVDASGHWLTWGHNTAGEALVLPAGTAQLLAAPVPELTFPATAITATGQHHACALVSGVVTCWGANDFGQCDPSAPSATVASPTVVTGLPAGVTDISLGRYHTCVLAGTSLYCWGSRDELELFGSVDAGTTDAGIGFYFTTPTPIATPSPGFQSLVPMRNAGDLCAIDTADLLWCWGAGYGTAGTTPARIPNLPTVRSASVSWTHGCAITLADEIWCWGLDESGERGQGTLSPSDPQPAVPVIW